MALMALTALMALVPLMTWRETLMALMALTALMALVPLMTRGGDPPSPPPFLLSTYFDIRRNLIVTHKRTNAQTHTQTHTRTDRQTASKLFLSYDVCNVYFM